jgi:hypothetical protein
MGAFRQCASIRDEVRVMAPPDVGSEVHVRLPGRITRYNNDNTVNIKLDSRPGRPRKVPFEHVLTPPVAEPVSRLPSPSEGDTCSEPAQKASASRLLSWATFVSVAGAIVLGIFHGIGTKILEVFWPYLRPLLRFLG